MASCRCGTRRACARAARSFYHSGLRGEVSRTTLADANEARDWRIYADLAHGLIRQARQLYAHDDLGVEREQTAYALDATTIDLSLFRELEQPNPLFV